MDITWLPDATPRPRRLAVGEFDGVHVGHREVIAGADSVLTFEPHPRTVVAPDKAPKLITSLETKVDLIAGLGVDELVVIPFDGAFATRVADMVELDGEIVSSTHIRGLVVAGDLEQANRFLGSPFQLRGPVAHGDKRGRTLGFPTANLVPDPALICPAHGVAVRGEAGGVVRLRDEAGLIALAEPRADGTLKPVVGFRG